MRPVRVLVLLLVLAGCGEDRPSVPQETVPADPVPTAAAQVVVEQYYTAFGLSDCITMRLLSTPAEQQENDAWADCIEVVAEVGVVGYAYEVLSAETGDSEASFVVEATGDAGTRTDDIRLVLSGGAWLVDDGVVTAR